MAGRRWLPAEDKLIADMVPAFASVDELCEALPGRSRDAIKWRVKWMGLRILKSLCFGRMAKRWTSQDHWTLLSAAGKGKRLVDVAQKLGRSRGAAGLQIQKLGIRWTQGLIKWEHARRLVHITAPAFRKALRATGAKQRSRSMVTHQEIQAVARYLLYEASPRCQARLGMTSGHLYRIIHAEVPDA